MKPSTMVVNCWTAVGAVGALEEVENTQPRRSPVRQQVDRASHGAFSFRASRKMPQVREEPL